LGVGVRSQKGREVRRSTRGGVLGWQVSEEEGSGFGLGSHGPVPNPSCMGERR